MSEQQVLSLAIPEQKHYGNWVRHSGTEEANGRLALWFVQGGLLWLSSDEMAGKSHFMCALKKEQPQAVLLNINPECTSSISQLKAWLGSCEHHTCWILDLPSGSLPVSVAYAVFHLIERAKQMNRSLLISWRCAQSDMHPPELSSRLLMMERIRMFPPENDEDLKLVLKSVLQTMQWDMKDTVLPMLLSHVPRQLSQLLSAVEKLDIYSKQQGVKVNAALALRVLQDD